MELKLQIVCRSAKNKTLSGFATIVAQLARESKDGLVAERDLTTQCLIDQWFDYAGQFVVPAATDKHTAEGVLQEIDEFLSTRSYLVGQNLSLADVVVFYSIQPVVVGICNSQ